MRNHILIILTTLIVAYLVSGCATIPKPTEVVVPEPIEGVEGKYMSPYTSDEVVAEWVDKAINVKIGSAVGGYAGKKAGAKLAGRIPIFGGLLGKKAGEKAGREVAIKLSGGWEYIRETSDLSFNSIDNMIIYLYATYSTNEHYSKTIALTKDIYPEMKDRWDKALKKAPRK